MRVSPSTYVRNVNSVHHTLHVPAESETTVALDLEAAPNTWERFRCFRMPHTHRRHPRHEKKYVIDHCSMVRPNWCSRSDALVGQIIYAATVAGTIRLRQSASSISTHSMASFSVGVAIVNQYNRHCSPY